MAEISALKSSSLMTMSSNREDMDRTGMGFSLFLLTDLAGTRTLNF